MRKVFSIFVLVLAVLALSTSIAFAGPNGTDRPFKTTSLSGVGTVDPVTGTFVIDGTAQEAHLGRSTFHVDGVFTGPNTASFTATIVATNGDTLTTSATNFATGPTTFTNFQTITGGTGRFAGATGSFTDTGTTLLDPSNPTSFTITLTSTGTISY